MVEKRLSVIIADDEDLARYTLKTLIARKHSNLEVITEATDGEEAVKSTVLHKPDLVILDIRMPVLDGLEAARRIRYECPWTAILILTAYEDFSFAQQAINSGVNGYLLKPVSHENFSSRIKEIEAWKRYHNQKDISDEIGKVTISCAENDNMQTVSWRLKKAIDFITIHLSEDLPVLKVSEAAGISPQHLSRLFRKELKINYIRFVTDKRINQACILLNNTTCGVAEIANRCGYKDANYFAKVFHRWKDTSPSNYRNGIPVKSLLKE